MRIIKFETVVLDNMLKTRYVLHSSYGRSTELSTCSNCESNKECEYTFDEYNTYGDCLAIK